jgi:DNA-binding MarR family transcriptional regulator
MTFKLRKSDIRTLEHVADHRILTMAQLAAVLQKNKPAVRKRIRDFKREGLVEVVVNEFGQSFGRPESLIGLSEQGADHLKENKLIAEDVPYEDIGPVSPRLINHQLLLNWFRIHLEQTRQAIEGLRIRFLAYNSPFVSRGPDGRVITADCSPIGRKTVREVKFTPDGVCAITHSTENKTLLFFLEVDCGTETLSSPQRDMRDIRQKILKYQWYFQSLKYKRYEAIFKTSNLRGFRVLFLTKTAGRLAALCKLTQEMQPSRFIWLTEQERIFNEGVSAKIWARGGNLHATQQSILGRLCCKAPLPAL